MANTTIRLVRRVISYLPPSMMSPNQLCTTSHRKQETVSCRREPAQLSAPPNLNRKTLSMIVLIVSCLTALFVITGCSADTDNAQEAAGSSLAQTDTRGDSMTSARAEKTVITIDTTQQVRISSARAESLLASPDVHFLCPRADSIWMDDEVKGEYPDWSIDEPYISIRSGSYKIKIAPHKLIRHFMANEVTLKKYLNVSNKVRLDTQIFLPNSCGVLKTNVYRALPGEESDARKMADPHIPKMADIHITSEGEWAESIIYIMLIDDKITILARGGSQTTAYMASREVEIHPRDLGQPLGTPSPLSEDIISIAAERLPTMKDLGCSRTNKYPKNMLYRSGERKIYPGAIQCIITFSGDEWRDSDQPPEAVTFGLDASESGDTLKILVQTQTDAPVGSQSAWFRSKGIDDEREMTLTKF